MPQCHPELSLTLRSLSPHPLLCALPPPSRQPTPTAANWESGENLEPGAECCVAQWLMFQVSKGDGSGPNQPVRQTDTLSPQWRAWQMFIFPMAFPFILSPSLEKNSGWEVETQQLLSVTWTLNQICCLHCPPVS